MTTKETAAATTTKQAAARQRAFAQLDATFRSGVTRPLRWRKAQLDAMARMLRQNATVIARAVRADLGKPAAETALMEIGLVLDEIRFIKPRLGRWAARHPKPMHYLLQPAVGWTVAEPKGVALIISPWNYPVLLSFEPMADAIAAGNCVCMKPSELSPHTSGVMADLIARYMDPQAFRVVQGGPQETTKLLEQPFNHIFYTGGGKVGSIVMAAAAKHLTPVTLELGGKSPVFVDRTANLDVAARRIAWGRFINAGQTCVAPDYVLTTSDVIEPLAGKIAEAVTRFFGSDPQHSDSFGRIINARHFDRLTALLPDPKSPATGRTVCGGNTRRDDLYIAPTVLLGRQTRCAGDAGGDIRPDSAHFGSRRREGRSGIHQRPATPAGGLRVHGQQEGTADVRARSQLRSAGIQPAAWPSDLQSAAVRRRGSFGHGLISRQGRVPGVQSCQDRGRQARGAGYAFAGVSAV